MRRKDVYVPRFLRATHLRHRRFAAMHSVAIYLRRVYTCRNGLYVRARDITVYIVGRSVYRVHLPPPPGRESVGGSVSSLFPPRANVRARRTTTMENKVKLVRV